MRQTFTLFARTTAQAARALKSAPIHPLLKRPEDPILAKVWDEMRAKLDTKEHAAHIEKIMGDPDFEKNQKRIAERLGELLEGAAKSNSYYS